MPKKTLLSLLLLFLTSLVVVPVALAQIPPCANDTQCNDPNTSYAFCVKGSDGTYQCKNPAANITISQTGSQDVLPKLEEIYCQRRQGNQINLETWYGGKCDPEHPTNPDTIGFGDIIILDLYGKLAGEKSESVNWGDLIKNLFPGSSSSLTTQDLRANLDKIDEINNNSGGIGALAGIVGKMYSTPPISFNDYVAYVGNNIRRVNPVQPAYAQETGFGFQSIQAVLPIWRAFRNIAYLLFVLVFVFYGFLIMFRVKISAQATASIQAALPKIAIVLLTITFSYAIVGLAIDMSYVVTGVVWSILTQANVIVNYGGIIQDGFAQFVSGRTWGLAGPMIAMVGHILSFDLTGRILAAFMPGFIAGILAIPANFIIGLIILIAAFITIIRIAWMLLKAYVNLVLSTIFAPLILLPGVLPNNDAFSGWLRGIVAEISIFVVTTFCFLFSFYFIGPITFPVLQANLFQVGSLDTSRGMLIPPPLGGGQIGTTEGRFALLGIGIFFIIPGLADKIRKALKAPALDFSSDINRALQAGWQQYSNPRSLANKFGFGGYPPRDSSGNLEPGPGRVIGGAYSRVAGAMGGIASTATGRTVTMPTRENITSAIRETQIRGKTS